MRLGESRLRTAAHDYLAQCHHKRRPGRDEEIRDVQALWQQFNTLFPEGLSGDDQYRGLQAEGGGGCTHPSYR